MKGHELGKREQAFAALGRWISKHPYQPIVIWVVILIAAIPTLTMLGNVTNNSATTLPNSSPSIVAANEVARLFPNQTAGSSSIIALSGKSITGPVGQAVVVNLTRSILTNRSLQELTSVSTLYTSYGEYLTGQAELAEGFIESATQGNASLYSEVNGTAQLVWIPPGVYVQAWDKAEQGNPNASTGALNWMAYVSANESLGTITNGTTRAVEENILTVFYAGFNATTACTNEAGTPLFIGCADGIARQALPPLISSNSTPLLAPALALPVLSQMGIEDFIPGAPTAAALRAVTAGILATSTGMSRAWLLKVWDAFPGAPPTAPTLSVWAAGLADNTSVANYPLPIPLAIQSTFVDPAGNMTLVLLTYAVPDNYVTPNGTDPVFNNIGILTQLVDGTLRSTPGGSGLTYWQTGEAPLDLDENNILSDGLALTLPLSVSVLLIITALYFRSPVTPLAAFGPIAMALIVSMGATFLIGTFVTKVDVTTLTLQDAFVLGVGTDYAIFLFSRYREELSRKVPPKEAVVNTVTWAGESITISGVTVMISTLALTFSGVTLLSEWGMVLSVSVLIALLGALTVVPAILTLAGEKIFWPYSGKRLARSSRLWREKMSQGKTYFQKVGRFSVKRAVPVVVIAAVITVPIGYIALTAPVSYDFFGQLPPTAPSSQGLSKIAGNFGPGYAFPIQVLVTLKSPLMSAGGVNSTELRDVSNLTSLMNATPGVASVDSPTGPAGAPLSQWLAYSALPTADQYNLAGLLQSYVGTDGRTVLFTVIPSESGLSADAINALLSIEGKLSHYGASHPVVAKLAYGGAASELHDLDVQTTIALDNMITIVVIGLMLVLLVLLASLAIPILAIITIGVSIAWAWALTYLVMTVALGTPIFFFDRVVLFVIVLGLGMDYNIFILTRIREEKAKGLSTKRSVVRAVGYTGGIITAAALILASVFFVLATDSFALLRTIGFSLGIAVVLDAMVVRTFLMPALISLLGERVWWLPGRKKRPDAGEKPSP